MHASFPRGCCLVFGLLGATIGAAADKPAIGVTFQLTQPEFRANFPDDKDPATGLSSLDRCTQAAMSGIVNALAREIPFARFVPDPALPLQLHVVLTGEDSANANLVQTFFTITVTGLPATTAPLDLQLPFRSDQEFLDTIDPMEFPGQIATRFQAQAHANRQKIIDGLHISVAQETVLIDDRAHNHIYCVFPISYNDLKAFAGTTFVVVTEVEDGPVETQELSFTVGIPGNARVTLPPGFDGGLVAKEADPPPSGHHPLQQLLGPDFTGEQKRLKIDALLIRDYVAGTPALEERGPEEATP